MENATDYFRETGRWFVVPLRYPYSSGWKPVLVTVVLTMGNFLIIPVLIIMGYRIRLCRAVAGGETAAPKYENLGSMLIDGVASLLLSTVSFLFNPVTVILFVHQLHLSTPASDTRHLLNLILAVIVAYLMIRYYMTAIQILYAVTGDIREALSLSNIHTVAHSNTYFVGWIVKILLFVVFLISSMLLFFTIIGIPVALLLAVYLKLAIASLYGHIVFQLDPDGIDVAPVSSATHVTDTQ